MLAMAVTAVAFKPSFLVRLTYGIKAINLSIDFADHMVAYCGGWMADLYHNFHMHDRAGYLQWLRGGLVYI